MKENYRTNREIQKQRYKSVKWWIWIIIATGLMIIMNLNL